MKSLDKKSLKIEDFEDLMKEQDDFVEVKDIKKGDLIYECDFSIGLNYEFKAITDAHPYEKGWKCLLKNKEGEEFEIYVSGGTKPMYLPTLYRSPFIVESGDNGKIHYPIV